MAVTKCCVGGCNSTSNNYRLYSMPMNDQLRKLWMSFIAPSNPHLLLLTKTQLLRKCVCEKHFDKSQFNQAGVRNRYSYPCLLSEKEIHHGEQLSSEEHTVSNEHSYCSLDEKHENSLKIPVVMGTQECAANNEHNYCSADRKDIDSPVTPVIMGKQADNAADNVLTEYQCTNTHTTTKEEACSSIIGGKRFHTIHAKNFYSKTRRYIKECTSITLDSLGFSSEQRIQSAQKCAENISFMENFQKLNKKAKTFLLMQLRLARKNKMARRFSLDDKLLALTLLKQSPKGYKLLQQMFALPNKRTLERLAEKIVFDCGINENIFHHLKMSTRGWDVRKKLCSIVFDEVAITPNLTYNESKDKINGFVELGERKQKFADHALVFMIRGLCASWRQTIAYYFCAGTVSSAELQKILKEMIPRLIETGLKPLALVCDQGSTFRSCFKILKEDTVRLQNSQGRNYDGTVHIGGVDLFCFFDPPHLLKGIRNNFLDKDIHWINGKTASWKDIQYIYDLDSKSGHTRALPNLTAENTDPKKIKKMKVKAAAQVLSSRTASMLHFVCEVHKRFNDCSATMKTTAEAVEFFDELFDSVNGSPGGGGAKGKKLRCAIKTDSAHEEFWKSAIQKLKSIKFIDKSSKLALTSGKPRYIRVPSLDGWIITLESFLGLTKLLFNEYGVEYFYPRNKIQNT